MNPNRFIDMMMRLGIPETQARVYLALLNKRELSAMEIQELTRVPRTKVYEVTQQMIIRGLCIEKRMGRSKKYQAVEPKRALESLIHDQENELTRCKALANEMDEELKPLYTQAMQKTVPTNNIEIMKDMKTIHERYVNLLRATQETMIAFAKPPSAHENKTIRIRQQLHALFDRLEHGIDIRMLFELADKRFMDAEAIRIEQMINAGCQARILEQVPIKAYVFDDTYVLMALDNPPSETIPLTMILVEHKTLASTFRILFDHLWEQAKDSQIYDFLRRSKYITHV